MSAPATIRPIPLGTITIFRIVSGLERVLDAIAAWRNARATEKTLLHLSDEQLSDIGLSRGEITVVAEDLARA